MKRLLLSSAMLAAAAVGGSQAAAADDVAAGSCSIARLGNTLIITAPEHKTDPKVARSLLQRVTVDFEDAAFEDVCEFLRTATGTNIVVAPEVTANPRTVTLKAKDMTLDNVLNWVSKLANVHYGFMHGAIYFSETPMAGDTVTRMYDVSGLVMPTPYFPGPELAMTADGKGAMFLPPVDDKETQTTDDIVDFIKKNVSPEAWNE